MSHALTPTQDLVMEVLAARRRMGENLWTFESRHTKTINQLAELGLVYVASGVVEKTIRATLTDAGVKYSLSSSYKIPSDPYRTLERVRDIVRQYEDWFIDAKEDSWRLQRDLMAALSMKRLEDLDG